MSMLGSVQPQATSLGSLLHAAIRESNRSIATLRATDAAAVHNQIAPMCIPARSFSRYGHFGNPEISQLLAEKFVPDTIELRMHRGFPIGPIAAKGIETLNEILKKRFYFLCFHELVWSEGHVHKQNLSKAHKILYWNSFFYFFI